MRFLKGVTPARLGQAGDRQGEAGNLQGETEPSPPAIDFAGQDAGEDAARQSHANVAALRRSARRKRSSRRAQRRAPKPFWRAEIILTIRNSEASGKWFLLTAVSSRWFVKKELRDQQSATAHDADREEIAIFLVFFHAARSTSPSCRCRDKCLRAIWYRWRDKTGHRRS